MSSSNASSAANVVVGEEADAVAEARGDAVEPLEQPGRGAAVVVTFEWLREQLLM